MTIAKTKLKFGQYVFNTCFGVLTIIFRIALKKLVKFCVVFSASSTCFSLRHVLNRHVVNITALRLSFLRTEDVIVSWCFFRVDVSIYFINNLRQWRWFDYFCFFICNLWNDVLLVGILLSDAWQTVQHFLVNVVLSVHFRLLVEIFEQMVCRIYVSLFIMSSPFYFH